MNTTTATSPARAKLQAKIDTQTVDQMLAHHAHLDKTPNAETTQEHRMVSAMLADTIEARLGISADVELVFMDEAFTGTYHDALLLAIVINEAAK